MILNAIFSFSPDGLIKYNGYASGQDIPLNEESKVQLNTLTIVHKAIEEAVKNINSHLTKEDIAEKLVIPEP